MGMEDARRVLLAGAVVPGHQVQHIARLAVVVQNGGHGVVGHALAVLLGGGQNVRRRVGIAPPGLQELLGKGLHLGHVTAGDAHSAHRPAQRLDLHVRIRRVLIGVQRLGALHGEGVAAALEVHVAENAAAHNGQVRVGAAGVMGKLAHKIKQLGKGARLNAHGLVFFREHDAVLVVIDIGAVLQVPALAAQAQGHDAVVLARGEVHPARVADVLRAQHALGIAGRGLQALQSDGLGVLFRLGQVDGDLQRAVFAGIVPLNIFGDLCGADVVGHDAQIVEVVRGGLGTARFPQCVKLGGHLAFPGHNRTHDARFKVHAQSGHLVVKQAFFGGAVQKAFQNFRGYVQMFLGHFPRPGLGQAEQVQQGVAGHILVQFGDERMLQAETKQPFDQKRGLCHENSSSCGKQKAWFASVFIFIISAAARAFHVLLLWNAANLSPLDKPAAGMVP